MRTILVISTAALALTACQKSTGASGAAGSAAGPTATPAAAPMLGGTPQPTPGLWQETMSRDGKDTGMGGMKICMDAAMVARDAVFRQHAGAARSMEPDNCTHQGPNRGLDGSWSFSSTCQLQGGGTRVSNAKATGDWSNSYHVEIATDVNGGGNPHDAGHHVIVIDAKRMGDCPAGMAGGDMQLPNGMTINTAKLAAEAKMLRGGGGGAPGGQ